MDRIESVQTPLTPVEVTFFWMMSVQVQAPRGLQFLTREGTIGLMAGRDTRRSAYGVLLAEMRRQAGIREDDPIVVLAYTLEPDALDVR